jgi:hypothetical protein
LDSVSSFLTLAFLPCAFCLLPFAFCLLSCARVPYALCPFQQPASATA